MAGPGKRGRKPWEPNTVQVEEAKEARLHGANLDAIAESVLHINPATLHRYLTKHPESDLSKALTRAFATTKVIAAGWLYDIMSDLKGLKTGAKPSDRLNALKFWLARQGGPEWKEALEVTGQGGTSLIPPARSLHFGAKDMAELKRVLSDALKK